jgi:5-methylcytosine-specific restriction endonuclease McrA
MSHKVTLKETLEGDPKRKTLRAAAEASAVPSLPLSVIKEVPDSPLNEIDERLFGDKETQVGVSSHETPMKKCYKCKEIKSLDDFYRDRSSWDGYKGACKSCSNKAVRAWIENNRDSRREHVRAFDKRNPEWNNAKTAKRRSQRKAAEVEELDNLYIERVYEFYGRICLSCESEDVSLDHVIPLSKGGTHSYKNFQPLCMACNMKKGNRSAADYRDIQKGILVGMIFDQKMILSRPKIVTLAPL